MVIRQVCKGQCAASRLSVVLRLQLLDDMAAMLAWRAALVPPFSRPLNVVLAIAMAVVRLVVIVAPPIAISHHRVGIVNVIGRVDAKRVCKILVFV